MNSFSFPTDISFGHGVISHFPKYLQKHGLIKPLIVTDQVIQGLSFFQDIMNDLNKSGVDPLVFADISKNPVKSDVLNGKEAYLNNRDCIVGIGGGAALDVSRAIALSINNHRDLF